MCKRNINWLPLASPQPGSWPTTQACALTGNQTGDLSFHRTVLNPLSHTSQREIFTVFDWLQVTVLKVHAHAGCGGGWWLAHTCLELDSQLQHTFKYEQSFVSWHKVINWLSTPVSSLTLHNLIFNISEFISCHKPLTLSVNSSSLVFLSPGLQHLRQNFTKLS